MIKLPFGVDVDNLIDDLRKFSWEAADILLYYSNIIKNSEQNIEVLKNKNINDPVTLADLEVNDLIINRINQKYQHINWEILSEENYKIESNPCNNNAEWLWVLDPLDGTKDFIQGTGNYAMHLALNYKQKPFIGVVLIPEKNELWISSGDKLWREKRDGSIIKNDVPKNKSLKEMILVTSKNHNNATLKKLIQKINFYDVITMGSIGCKIASIIRGESDLYICLSLPNKSAPKDWDFAAPQAILKAAGGAITNIDNESLSYGKSNFEHGGIIVASNNYLVHPRICLQIKEIIEKHEIYPY